MATVCAVWLTGCRAQPTLVPTPAVPPTPTADPAQPVRWPRSATFVMFRADEAALSDTLLARNAVPPCTVYGDNRVVWLARGDGDALLPLFDVVDDAAILAFVQTLLGRDALYSYRTAEAEDGTILPAPAPPRDLTQPPPLPFLLLHVNDFLAITEQTDGWPDVLFARALADCTRLSSAPILVEPEGLWLSAQSIAYDPFAFVDVWTSDQVRLADVAATGERVWVGGGEDEVAQLWQAWQRNPSRPLLGEDGQHYEVAVEVPRVMRSAPPAP